MGKGISLISANEIEEESEVLYHHILENVGATNINVRTITSNDARATLTLDQNGSGINLLLNHATQPEIRFAEEDQTDPAGRWRIRLNTNDLYLDRALTANWATSDNVIKIVTEGTTGPVDVTIGSNETTEMSANDYNALATGYYAIETTAAYSMLYSAFHAFSYIDSGNTQNWTRTPVGSATVKSVLYIEGSGTITGATLFLADASTVGTGATLTNYYGFYYENVGSINGTLTNQYGIYLEAPTKGATINTGLYIGGGGTYAIYSDAGLNRFDGDGTNIFELPADATDPTGGGGAGAGRIPIKVGGVTKYLAYY